MIRKFLGGTALAGAASTAYVYSDPGARRSFDFWSRLGPVVADYLGTILAHKYIYRSTGKEKVVIFKQLHERSAPKVLKAIVDLRGIFIKAGQYLSVRPEITPEPYRRRFKMLQTDAPSEPLSVILSVVEKELGRPISEMYSHIEPIPCGAASTAQAHVATLKETGETVVIKVQYPDAEAWFNSDIKSLITMAILINKFDDAVDKDELMPLLDEFKKQFLAEFDYIAEQKNMMRIGNAIRQSGRFDQTIIVPQVIPSLCSKRVITMTYLPGPTLQQKASVLLSNMGIDLRQGVSKFFKNTENEPESQDENVDSSSSSSDRDSDRDSDRGNDVNVNVETSLSRAAWTGTYMLQMIGPDVAFRLKSMVDGIRTACRRAAVFLLLDVLRFSPGAATVTTAQATTTTLSLENPLENPIVPAIESWGEWAGRTRRELKDIDTLSNIYAWLDVLLDVHGFEVFHIGLFNGDPHPGNILVCDDDRLGLIDYGQVKLLSKDSQLKLAKLVCMVADENSSDDDLAKAFRNVGVVTKNDSTPFIAMFARLMLGKLKSEHLAHSWHIQLHKMDRMVHFPPDMMIMVRVAMLLRGMGLLLNQNISVSERWKLEAVACIERAEKVEKAEAKTKRAEVEVDVEGVPIALSLTPSRRRVLSQVMSTTVGWYRQLSTAATTNRNSTMSPYRLFGLSKNATEENIRTRFRELAYEHHPDLNIDADDDGEMMKDIVEAYQVLLSSTGAGAARDSSVAINVEKFTIHELMQDKEHTVVQCIVSLDDMLESGVSSSFDVHDDESNSSRSRRSSSSTTGNGEGKSQETSLTDVKPRVNASRYDSVADLKRDLQSRYANEWGLSGRRFDHEQVAIGWELVHDGDVLCPNYFLGDYNIKSGDCIHAIIRNA
jgi:aarF domain-containing kinase